MRNRVRYLECSWGTIPSQWLKEMQWKHTFPFKPRRKFCLTKSKLSAILFPFLPGSEMFRSKIVTHSTSDLLRAVLYFNTIPATLSTTSIMFTYTQGKKKTFKKCRFHTTLHTSLSKFGTIDQLTINLPFSPSHKLRLHPSTSEKAHSSIICLFPIPLTKQL